MISEHSFLIRRLYTCSQINQYQFNSGTKEYKHCQKCKALIYSDWKFCQCICIADSVMYIMFVFAVRRRSAQTLESSMIKEKKLSKMCLKALKIEINLSISVQNSFDCQDREESRILTLSWHVVSSIHRCSWIT